MDNLKDIQVKAFKPKNKPYTKYDGKGLYIEVKSNGNKYWRMNYKYSNKEKTLTIGEYPTVSLKEAREARFKALKQLSKNIDPVAHKQAKKLETNKANN